jgi:DNA-binding CsgD family transcriptional regulator
MTDFFFLDRAKVVANCHGYDNPIDVYFSESASNDLIWELSRFSVSVSQETLKQSIQNISKLVESFSPLAAAKAEVVESRYKAVDQQQLESTAIHLVENAIYKGFRNKHTNNPIEAARQLYTLVRAHLGFIGLQDIRDNGRKANTFSLNGSEAYISEDVWQPHKISQLQEFLIQFGVNFTDLATPAQKYLLEMTEDDADLGRLYYLFNENPELVEKLAKLSTDNEIPTTEHLGQTISLPEVVKLYGLEKVIQASQFLPYRARLSLYQATGHLQITKEALAKFLHINSSTISKDLQTALTQVSELIENGELPNNIEIVEALQQVDENKILIGSDERAVRYDSPRQIIAELSDSDISQVWNKLRRNERAILSILSSSPTNMVPSNIQIANQLGLKESYVRSVITRIANIYLSDQEVLLNNIGEQIRTDTPRHKLVEMNGRFEDKVPNYMYSILSEEDAELVKLAVTRNEEGYFHSIGEISELLNIEEDTIRKKLERITSRSLEAEMLNLNSIYLRCSYLMQLDTLPLEERSIAELIINSIDSGLPISSSKAPGRIAGTRISQQLGLPIHAFREFKRKYLIS